MRIVPNNRMNKRFLNKEYIFFMCLFLTVFVIGLFFCMKKSGLFIDEVTSIGQANSDKGGWIGEVRDEYVDGNMIGHTITGKEIFDYLTVDVDERFDVVSTYNNLATDVHPPLYHILLKIFYSFIPLTVSWRPGLILNLIIYMLCNLVLFKICHKLFNNITIASLTMFLYAVSPPTLSSLVFIRMYILLSLMTMLLLYEIILFLEKPRKILYPLITITILLGMLTQYLYAIPAFFLCLVTLIILVKRKQIEEAVWFSISSVAGVDLLFVVFPLLFVQSGAKFFSDSTIISSVMTNPVSLGFTACLKNIINSIHIVLTESLPTVELSIVLAFVCVISVVFLYYRKSNGDKNVKIATPLPQNVVTVLIVDGFALIASCATISLTAKFAIERYYYNIHLFIYPFVCLLFYLALHYTKQTHKTVSVILIAVSMIAIIGMSFIVAKNRHVPDLFESYDEYEKMVSDRSYYPCIYVSTKDQKMINAAALQFMTSLDDVYVTYDSAIDINGIKSYISKHPEQKRILVITYWMEDNEKLIIDYLSASLGYSESKELFRFAEDGNACYVLE